MFKNLTPQKKKVLLIGGAVIAIAALYLYMRSKSEASSPEGLAQKRAEEQAAQESTYPSAYDYSYPTGSSAGTAAGGGTLGEAAEGPAGPAGPEGGPGPEGPAAPASPAAPAGPENKTKHSGGHTKAPARTRNEWSSQATNLEKKAASLKKSGHKSAARREYRKSQQLRRKHKAPKHK